MGAGKYLKEKNPALQVIAVEPAGSPVLSDGLPGTHKIQGLGAGFIPDILDMDIYDEIIAVSDEHAFETCRELVRIEGVLCGVSSGAALYAAKYGLVKCSDLAVMNKNEKLEYMSLVKKNPYGKNKTHSL